MSAAAPAGAKVLVVYTDATVAREVLRTMLEGVSRRDDVVDHWLTTGDRGARDFCQFRRVPAKGVNHRLVGILGHPLLMRDLVTGRCAPDTMLVFTSVIQDDESIVRLQQAAALARLINITRVAVVLDHMEKINFDEKESSRTVSVLSALFAVEHFCATPISSADDANIEPRDNHRPETMPWYRGPAALNLLDSFPPRPPLEQAPMRSLVLDNYKIGGVGIVTVVKIVSGTVKWPGHMDDHMAAVVSGLQLECTVLEIHHCWVHDATAGERVGLQFRPKLQTVTQLPRGDLLCYRREGPIPISSTRFTVLITVISASATLTAGVTMTLRLHSIKAAATITRIDHRLANRTGTRLSDACRGVRLAQVAQVVIDTDRPICLEPSSAGTQLDRFVLLAEGGAQSIVAVGTVLRAWRSEDFADDR